MHSQSRFPTAPARWAALALASLACAATVLTLPLSAAAQMYGGVEAPEVDVDPTLERTIPGQPLALDEAIALGLRNNLNVEISRYAPYIAELNQEAAWGAFDPVFDGNVGYEDTDVPTNSTFASRFIADNLQGEAGVSALVPYIGATANINFESNEETTNNVTAAYSPAWGSALTIGGEIPLMRGLIWNEPWTQVRTLKFASEQSRHDFETSVMDVVQGIISEYWNLVASAEQLRVAEKSLETTTALLDQTQTQYDVGVVSKVEVVQAEAGVASSEFDLIVARNQYQNAQDQLIATLLGRRLTAATSLTFSPTDNPAYERISYVDVEKAVANAFSLRPEIRSAESGIEQAEIQRKFARNQRLPDVSFAGSYRTNGLIGEQNPNLAPGFPPPGTEGNYGDTFNDWGDRRVWTAGARVSIPLGNIRARKEFHRAEFELRRAESSRTQLKQRIIVDIRAAARGLIASAEGVEAAERRRIAAAEQLRAERIRLEHGESTPFDVLQRQNDLVEAESQKVAALQAFRDSQAALDRAEGTILQVHNVQIDAVRALD